FAKGNQLFAMASQLGAVSKQKEQHIQHDAKSDQKFEGILSDTDGIGGDQLAEFERAFRQSFAKGEQIIDAESLQDFVDKGWHGSHRLFEVVAQIEFARIHAPVNVGAFLQQRTRN